ncbi:MAG: NAD(P)/FAD-dependent oxidoreductase [Paracoccaceae bacterium]
MTSRNPFSNCVASPYWLEDAPQRPPEPGPLPARADLVVVGSGYTGLSAAIVAARGGMSVLVLDRGAIGAGCSTRNGGLVASSIKPELGELTARHGDALARRIRDEGYAALAYTQEIIVANGIDCDWRKTGRYTAAHSPKRYEGLERWAEARHRAGEPEITLVPRAEQHRELGSDRYFGGAISPFIGAVHPARLHAGLLRVAEGAGVVVRGGCEVTGIRRDGDGSTVQVGAATVRARHVLIATNGYSGPLSPWLRRRVIPIGSYMLATEPLAAEVAARLIPQGRMVVDTRRVVIYFRLSPDGRRLIFGGRAALAEADPIRVLPRLYDLMLDVFPQLAGTPVSHTWNGFVAYTFDELPHIGVQDGVHYCMGYCGSGISLSLYFGMRAGLKILGRAEGATALDGLRFQTRPLYYGTPWFLAPSVAYYRMADRVFA